MQNPFSNIKEANSIWAILSIILIACLGYGYYKYHSLQVIYNQTLSEKAEVEGLLVSSRDAIVDLEEKNAGLRDDLGLEKEKVSEYEEEIDDINDRVDELEKLTETDKQLLEKYSKVYFLNEHYVPERLSTIDPDYVFDKTREQQIHRNIRTFFRNMVEDATDDGIDLLVISAYRSFGSQATLKANYRVTYGAGTANQFSADQGYSEHQLGTAVDFTTPELGANFERFDTTPAYQWLLKNAYKYGFVLSYPQGNAYYQFEPWHWRFVGRDLARTLDRKDMNFYDMEQREINEYLISLFD